MDFASRRDGDMDSLSSKSTYLPEGGPNLQPSPGPLPQPSGAPLHRQVTMQLSPEQYERLFFQPTRAKGDFAKRLGNPTLLGLVGFLVPFTCTSFCLCGFQNGGISLMVAVSPCFYFFGGIAMVIAGIAEFILGNTYPFTIFVTYGCHLLTGAYSGDPSHMIAARYVGGYNSHEYNTGSGFYSVNMAIVSFIFLCGSIRTNALFVIMFASLIPFFAFIAAGQFETANNPTPEGIEYATKLFKASGSFGFIVLVLGWYLSIVSSCASTAVPCPLPVFDLSEHVFPDNREAQLQEHAGAIREKVRTGPSLA